MSTIDLAGAFVQALRDQAAGLEASAASLRAAADMIERLAAALEQTALPSVPLSGKTAAVVTSSCAPAQNDFRSTLDQPETKQARAHNPLSQRDAHNLATKYNLAYTGLVKGGTDVADIRATYARLETDRRNCWDELDKPHKRMVKTAQERLQKAIAEADDAIAKQAAKREKAASQEPLDDGWGAPGYDKDGIVADREHAA